MGVEIVDGERTVLGVNVGHPIVINRTWWCSYFLTWAVATQLFPNYVGISCLIFHRTSYGSVCQLVKSACVFVVVSASLTINITSPPPKYFGKRASLSHNHATKSPSVTMGRSKFTPKTAPSLSILHQSLDWPHSKSQMASRSNQPLCHSTLPDKHRQTDRPTDRQTDRWDMRQVCTISAYARYIDRERRAICTQLSPIPSVGLSVCPESVLWQKRQWRRRRALPKLLLGGLVNFQAVLFWGLHVHQMLCICLHPFAGLIKRRTMKLRVVLLNISFCCMWFNWLYLAKCLHLRLNFFLLFLWLMFYSCHLLSVSVLLCLCCFMLTNCRAKIYRVAPKNRTLYSCPYLC